MSTMLNNASAPPQKKGGGLFSSGEKKPAGNSQESFLTEMNNLARRLKVLEERYTNMRRKTQVTDQNMLAHNKKFMSEIKVIHSDIDELRKNMDEIDNKMLLIIRELRLCAKREELAVLQKYINLWEPVHFVTRREVEKILQELLESKKTERDKALGDMFK